MSAPRGWATGSVSDLGEDELVRSVIARYAGSPAFVTVGPGDDAAVLDLRGPVVASTDTLVEGRDFLRRWSSGHDVGVKTAAQNLADIAAMGGRPLALLVSLAAPGDLPAAFAEGLAAGLQEECARAGASVVGGDVSNASEVVVTGTALGVLDGVAAVLRSGALPGDVVAVAGRTGPSGAGLALLLAADGPATRQDTGPAVEGAVSGLRAAGFGALLDAHLAPRPPYEAGPDAARAGAHAMIDTSDGLLRDADRLAHASGAVLDLDPALLTPPDDLRAAAAHLGGEALALEWVLTGGEDHAMLACFAPGATLPAGFRRVGRVLALGDGRPGPTVLVGGRPWSGSTGWHHWA